MTIQRYEIDIERDEDEQGNAESILAPYKHDKGDWCKAEDVDALEAENARLIEEIEQTTPAAMEAEVLRVRLRASHAENARVRDIIVNLGYGPVLRGIR
jgi:chromosome condensin MukBEF ATPase and DNA-binding subunit MukB